MDDLFLVLFANMFAGTFASMFDIMFAIRYATPTATTHFPTLFGILFCILLVVGVTLAFVKISPAMGQPDSHRCQSKRFSEPLFLLRAVAKKAKYFAAVANDDLILVK